MGDGGEERRVGAAAEGDHDPTQRGEPSRSAATAQSSGSSTLTRREWARPTTDQTRARSSGRVTSAAARPGRPAIGGDGPTAASTTTDRLGRRPDAVGAVEQDRRDEHGGDGDDSHHRAVPPTVPSPDGEHDPADDRRDGEQPPADDAGPHRPLRLLLARRPTRRATAARRGRAMRPTPGGDDDGTRDHVVADVVDGDTRAARPSGPTRRSPPSLGPVETSDVPAADVVVVRASRSWRRAASCRRSSTAGRAVEAGQVVDHPRRHRDPGRRR